MLISTLRRAYQQMRVLVIFLAKKTHWLSKRAHHHVAHRPHQHLMARVAWYRRWHSWEFHTHVHASLLVVYGFVVGATVLFYHQQAFASSITQSWNFSSFADYDYDGDDIEVTGSEARLKAQNYTSDASTVGLWHFDEVSGTTALDASSFSHTGTIQGAALFTVGILNNSLDLNASGDFVAFPDSDALTLAGSQTLEAWVKFDDGFSSDESHDAGIIDKGSYRLYYDRTSGRVNYEIATSGADVWTRRAGGELAGSWDDNGKTIVRSMVSNGDNVYAGLGLSTGDADVWHWNGTTWTQIGGDGLRGSWADAMFEDVNALTIADNKLYAGLGTNAAGDAEVWMCDLASSCASWAKIGGDGINSGWALGTFESVNALVTVGTQVYAGIGNSTTDAEVWRWNGSAWTKVGGDGVASSWNTNYEAVYSLATDGTNIFAGIGNGAADGEVWRYNGTTWAQIGGDGVASSWAAAENIEYVASMTYFGGNLYAGLASSTGDADVWRYNGTAWTKIGGDGLNSSWAASTYELVGALVSDGTNLYAGVGNGNGDGEVFRWNGTAWTKLGGDGQSSSWGTNFGDGVYALSYGNGTLSVGLYDSSGDGHVWQYKNSAWQWIGGAYVNKSWGYFGLQSVESSATANDKLYMGTGNSTAGNAMVWESDGTTWRLVGGQGVNGSWAANTYENIYTLQEYNGDLYAGMGTTAGDAEVWRYDGSSWALVGGDGVNSSWGAGYEAVWSTTVFDGQLYVGLGSTTNDAEVWRYNGTAWTKVGGDGLSSSWNTSYEAVQSLIVYKGQLYAGLGNNTLDAEVWRYNGTAWTKVGGDGLSSSWNTSYEEVFTMRVYREKLYVGVGAGTDDAEIWSYDGSTWALIGGDGVNGSWPAGTYERIRAMAVYNGELYTGIGDSTGDGEVWRFNGTAWTKVAGNSVNASWGSTIEYVATLIDYRGKLYAGTGNGANADAAVWSFGNNAFLASQTVGQDNQWHHIAATFNGTQMKLFIDGVEDASTNASAIAINNDLPLYIGSTHGSGGRGESQGYLKGNIDEVRLSNVARNSFTVRPYPTTTVMIAASDAVFTSRVTALESFVADEQLSGGQITYQLSNDNGETWQYWTGSQWDEAASYAQANAQAVIDEHIDDFEINFSGVRWRALLTSDGNQRVTLRSVTITASEDAIAPSVNATDIAARKARDGASFVQDAWTNGSSPYFSWEPGSDAQSGIYGYCAYLGKDETADIVTTKGLLGATRADTGGFCQFVTPTAELDLSEVNSFSSPLESSNDTYYLKLRAIDAAGNISASEEVFSFKFDNTPPRNPGFISAPSGFINTKQATLTWPASGGQAAGDDASGLAGLQYRIGSTGTWYGDAHDGTGSMSDLLANDGVYETTPTPDHSLLVDGTNTIFFRTWDQAGNVTSSFVSAALKINTNGSPSEPTALTANPSSNTTNAFSFSWGLPAEFVGDAATLNYCYSVNVLPSEATCSYTGTGVRFLSTGAYATNPGANVLYVVARDESGNINYSSYASTVFTANTSAPGIPGNVDIVDVSIKATAKWRIAITWDVPSTGASSVTSYRVFRSTDNQNFSLAGSSTSTTYIDAGLTQQLYYYRIQACDSTNNCSANSQTVSMLPTGKFTEPATMLGEPVASNLTTKRATITWTTDRVSDSKIAIGTTSGVYGASEIGSSDQVAIHAIDLENLAAGTTYYYVVKWTDVDGNTGVSQEYSFTTAPAPVVKEVETLRVGLADATIQFTSVNAVKVNLYYGSSEAFGGLKSINTSITESSYTVPIDGLSDGTKYYYQISAVDSEGAEYKGNVFSFTTPQRPRISNLRFEPIEGQPTSTQSITWTTNVPSTSTVTYGIIGTGGTDVQDSKMTTEHRIVIANLQDDSEYFLVAQSRDADGNLAVSDRQVFRTALDTRPPAVFDIVVESSIRGSGAEARGQVIVSWKTDEPSTSQVAYGEGSGVQVFNSRTSEDTQLTTEHIVVISNLPTSKVYSIQPLSFDRARNVGEGEVQTEIIGRASESVLTVILGSLQRIFGL